MGCGVNQGVNTWQQLPEWILQTNCVNSFGETQESLIHGEEVKFAGLGSFKILDKAPRMGRNPKTGAPAIISARRVATFRPSTEFRKRVA